MTNIAGSSNVLIPEARAKISMRIVPGSDPEKELDALVAHLESHAPWGAQVEVAAHQGGAAVPLRDRRTGLRRRPLGAGRGLRQAGGRGRLRRLHPAAAHPPAGRARRRVHPLGPGGRRRSRGSTPPTRASTPREIETHGRRPGAAAAAPGRRRATRLTGRPAGAARATFGTAAATGSRRHRWQDPARSSRTNPEGSCGSPHGTSFGFDDLVFYRGKGEVPFAEVAGRIDLILTGPHATAALPTRARAVPRARPHPAPAARLLRHDHERPVQALGRDRRARRLRRVPPPPDPVRPQPGLAGRPGGRAARVLRPAGCPGAWRECLVQRGRLDPARLVQRGALPASSRRDDAEWSALMGVITDLGERGARPYARIRDEVIETVFEAKCVRLHALDLDRCTVADFNSARMLHVQCVHDTMNATVGPDGAVDRDKPPADWLPRIVSLGNRGDERGEPRPPAGGGAPADGRHPDHRRGPVPEASSKRSPSRSTCPTRQLDDAARPQLAVPRGLRVPAHRRLLRDPRAAGHRAAHQPGEGAAHPHRRLPGGVPPRDPAGGRRTSAHVRQPGTDWPETDHAAPRRISPHGSRAAYDILRRWDYDVPPTRAYQPPRFR